MKVRARAYASATIVNAIPCGRGAAFAIDLPVTVSLETTEEGGPIEVACRTDASLVQRCVSMAFDKYGWETGAQVAVESAIPVARGLSSSSAVSNAAVLAAFSASGQEIEDDDVVNTAIDASIAEGVSVTGAFDDAYASYHGVAVATNNTQRTVAAHLVLPEDVQAIVLMPPEERPTASTDVAALRKRAKEARDVWDLAHTDPLRAMDRNGELICQALGIDQGPMHTARAAGALAASLSGTGSAFVALAPIGTADLVRDAWRELPGKTSILAINRKKASLVRPPSKLF